MKKKRDEFPGRCVTPCSGWVPTFEEGSLAIDLAKCCLAPWKKCVVAENQAAIAVVLPVVTVVAMAATEAAMVTVVAETIEEMAAGRAITGGTTAGLATADTGRVRGDSRSRSSRSTPKPPPRVTVDLPEAWKVADLDKDGQIGLYEWDRKKYKEFFALDTNRDSLLTPKEISRSSGASPAPSATAVAATTIPSSRSNSTKSAKPVAATPSGIPIVAVEYDASSAEGRWAKYVFGRLDKNKDGSLSADEWNGSVKTRDSFKKHNAQMSFPANFEAFAGLMVAVQRANRKK
jgi:hypothetical protein